MSSKSFVLKAGGLALLAVYGAWAWVSISQPGEAGPGRGHPRHPGPRFGHHLHGHPHGPPPHAKLGHRPHKPHHGHGKKAPPFLHDSFPFDDSMAAWQAPRAPAQAPTGQLAAHTGVAVVSARLDTAWPQALDGSLRAPPGARPPSLDLRARPVPAPSFLDADGRGRSALLPPLRLAARPDRVFRPGDGRLPPGEGPRDLTPRDHAHVAPEGLAPRGDPSEHPRPAHAAGATTAGADPAPGQAARAAGLQVTAAAETAPVVYTPAQIRQAYGLDTLPGATAQQGVYQGSGQIIAIVVAYHHPTLGDDVNVFSQRFGLPGCTVLPAAAALAPSPAALVDKPSPGDGCSLQWLHASSAGQQTLTPPATHSQWALEAALDVQWAHAVAPMAKIVIVQAASSSWSDTMGAMRLAARIPGVSAVSMSFGIPEWNTSPAYDAIMSGSATWVAASGDSGAQVNYPAASRNVLAVGGTYLATTAPRSEVAWSGAGGGMSAYHQQPAWQSGLNLPGYPAVNVVNRSRFKRAVPDVALNASEASSVYVTVNGTWMGMSGTSAAAPQWAGMVAIVNAVRASLGHPPFMGTGFQQALYRSAASSSQYAHTFLDVTTGNNGLLTCTSCQAVQGFDMVTGLGTPHVPALVQVMSTF